MAATVVGPVRCDRPRGDSQELAWEVAVLRDKDRGITFLCVCELGPAVAENLLL